MKFMNYFENLNDWPATLSLIIFENLYNYDNIAWLLFITFSEYVTKNLLTFS